MRILQKKLLRKNYHLLNFIQYENFDKKSASTCK